MIRKHSYSATILEKRKNKQNSAQSFCRGLISETSVENIPVRRMQIRMQQRGRLSQNISMGGFHAEKGDNQLTMVTMHAHTVEWQNTTNI